MGAEENRLVFLSVVFFFSLAFGGLGTNFFVILFQGGKILTGFGELTFFHTFTDVPVNEGTLGVHKVEFVVKTGEYFGDGGTVGNHAYGALYLGQVTSWNNSWWLVVDTALEPGWAPVNELDGTLGLDGGNGGVNVLWHNITTVHQAARHVLSVAWVALGHGGGRLEGTVGDFGDGQLFVVRFFGADDWGECTKHKVDSWVWHQVGLELGDINVQGTIESKGGGQTGDNLGNKTVQVGVGWALDVQGATADVVDGFVVKHDGNIGVL